MRLRITFRPKTRLRPDLDNCLASCKAGLDGLANVLGIDDSRFLLFPTISDPIKGGAVLVEIEG